MVKITCPHCTFEKAYEDLPTHASHAKCPKCNNSFSLGQAFAMSPPKEAFTLQPGVQKKLPARLSLQECPLCKTHLVNSDARCFACGAVLDEGLPSGNGGGELTATRFIIGSICIGLATLALGMTLSEGSLVFGHRGLRQVAHSEGAEILLFLAIALLVVIMLGSVGIKLCTPVKRRHH